MSTMSPNALQLSVLRWVADGSPDGVMDDYAHRVSAAALRARGLLRVSGRGPTWHAELTPDGHALLSRHAEASTGGMHDPPQPRVNEQLPKTEQLVAAVTRTGLGASPVPVPSRVRNHHAAARGFRDQTYVHEISRKTLPRAVRIVHGFANEIDRRGHRIAQASQASDDDRSR